MYFAMKVNDEESIHGDKRSNRGGLGTFAYCGSLLRSPPHEAQTSPELFTRPTNIGDATIGCERITTPSRFHFFANLTASWEDMARMSRVGI